MANDALAEVIIPNAWVCIDCSNAFFQEAKLAPPCPSCTSKNTNLYRLVSKFPPVEQTAADAADALLDNILTWTSRRDDDAIFLYQPLKGVFKPGESYAREYLAQLGGRYAQPAFYHSTIGVLSSKTYDAVPEPPLNLAVVENGVLNLETRELTPFTSDFFFLQSIPVKFVPGATCPSIEKFLSEVVTPEHKTTLIEFAGFCLWRSYRIEKAIIAPGTGANGKSIFASVLSTFLGHENTTDLTLQTLCENRFASANLYGKLANFAPDLPSDALRDVGTFKGLTGGDAVSGEHKFKRPFSFVNYAKFFFGCNQIPRTNDRSDGYMRRFIIVPFPKQFLPGAPGTKNREQLLAELTTPQELSGFLNLALDGLTSILKNGRFTHEQSIAEIRDTYLKASEPVTAFVYDACDLDGKAAISKSELYAAYTEFCRAKNFTIENEIKFGRSLKQVADVQDRSIGSGTERKTAWQGIQLKNTEPSQPPANEPQRKLSEGDFRA